MSLLAKLFYAVLVLIAASATIMGAAMMLAAHRDGAISYTMTARDGRVGRVLISRADQPQSYWNHFALFGGLPFLGGLAGLWLGVRGFRR